MKRGGRSADRWCDMQMGLVRRYWTGTLFHVASLDTKLWWLSSITINHVFTSEQEMFGD